MAKTGRIAYFALTLGYFAAAIGYAVYAAISGTGIYRVMTQWQLAVYDFYSGVLTFAVLFAALAALGIVLVAVLARWLIPAERSAALAHLVEPRTPGSGPAGLTPLSRAARRGLSRAGAVIRAAPLAAAALGAALLAGGIALGYAMAAKAGHDIAFQDVDLSRGEAPTAEYVRVTGIARTNLAIALEKSRRSGTTVETYIPITARDWRRGEPLTYFIKVTERDLTFITAEQRTAFSPTARPGLVTLAAAPRRGGLPFRVAVAFEEAHLSLAEAPVVLDLQLHPLVALLRQVAWIATVAGLILLPAGLLFHAAQRQSARRNRAP